MDFAIIKAESQFRKTDWVKPAQLLPTPHSYPAGIFYFSIAMMFY
jgi:hypothetical protein